MEFEFSKANLAEAKKIIGRYPKGREASALIPLLDLAQRQHENWLPRAAIEYVADMLHVPPMRAYEVATFYSMFNLAPVGKHFIQVCRTTPCWLRGSDAITETCKRRLGIGLKETTKDKKFTLVEVECLGACANAPMVQINDEYYEDLSPESMEALIDALDSGEPVKVGSQKGRTTSMPENGQTSLDMIEVTSKPSNDDEPRLKKKGKGAKKEASDAS